jgi:hypothetical protein
VEHVAIIVDDHDAIAATIDGFLSGEQPLTGLELYYALERATPLLGFHAMIRKGPLNLAANGLQQSYGDHNRLLMLGLDKLVAGDLDWYRGRLDGAGDVTDDELRACFATVAGLGLTRDVLLALWLAAALHDCGMLCGRGSSVDVEDGVALSRDVIEALCPEPMRPLAYFVIRHHDYIKDVFLGEVRAGFVADELEQLDASMQPVALAALGVVQVVGAASLGEGRLGSFRLDIFQRCTEGDALDDRSTASRLGRLLEPTPRADAPSPEDATARLAALGDEQRARVERFLASTALHGWQRASADVDRDDRMPILLEVVELCDTDPTDHVVVEGTTGRSDAAGLRARARMETVTALNGSRVLLLEV